MNWDLWWEKTRLRKTKAWKNKCWDLSLMHLSHRKHWMIVSAADSNKLVMCADKGVGRRVLVARGIWIFMIWNIDELLSNRTCPPRNDTLSFPSRFSIIVYHTSRHTKTWLSVSHVWFDMDFFLPFHIVPSWWKGQIVGDVAGLGGEKTEGSNFADFFPFDKSVIDERDHRITVFVRTEMNKFHFVLISRPTSDEKWIKMMYAWQHDVDK